MALIFNTSEADIFERGVNVNVFTGLSKTSTATQDGLPGQRALDKGLRDKLSLFSLRNNLGNMESEIKNQN